MDHFYIKKEDLAKKMGKDNFVATKEWFQRWKKRENISFIKAHEEQGVADFSAAQMCGLKLTGSK